MAAVRQDKICAGATNLNRRVKSDIRFTCLCEYAPVWRMIMTENEIYEKLMNCLACIRKKTDFMPKVALVLGSGLGNYGEKIRLETAIPYQEIEGFPVSTVAGHKGGSCSAMSARFRSSVCRGAYIIMRDMIFPMWCSRSG